MTLTTHRATDQQILAVAQLEQREQLVAALLLAADLGLRVERAECIALLGPELTLELVRGESGWQVASIRGLAGRQA